MMTNRDDNGNDARARAEAATLCPIRGEARVEVSRDRSVTWTQADPEIHVSPRLMDNDMARSMLETRYEIGEACPADLTYHHARLRDEGDGTGE